MSWLPLAPVNAKLHPLPHSQGCDWQLIFFILISTMCFPLRNVGPLHSLMKTNDSALYLVL